jgi:hypothetical protein
MADCAICSAAIPAGSRTCPLCGSGAEEIMPAATGLRLEKPARPLPAVLPPGCRYCPGCSEIFGPAYTDMFCRCGMELSNELPGASAPPIAPMLDDEPLAPFDGDLPPMAPILDDLPAAPILDDAPETEVKVRPTKPAPGTPCIVLYGLDKQPLQYFELAKDAMSIGRLDAVAGVFPDIDLDQWFDRATIRKISRQHALVLRTRATNTFVLRPLLGNTGTQLETDMLEAQKDYPLRPGHRILLGGVIRLKFEIA